MIHDRISTSISITISLCLVATFSIISLSNTSAITYQDDADIEFTINPSISVSISSGDLLIGNIMPGTSKDSNIVNITTSSNAVSGYNLYSTVGSSTYNTTEIRRNGTDTTNKFTSITTNKASLSNFGNDSWGYSWCSGNCTTSGTWVSGNVGSTSSGYDGLPLYNNTGVKLIDTTTSGSTTISFKVGAKASTAQTAGSYANVINFISVAKANP